MPHPAGARYSLPAAIACASANACTVVGTYFTSSFVMVTLAERWNGTARAIQPVPSPADSTYSQFDSVACASATLCTAAGVANFSTGFLGTLAERYS